MKLKELCILKFKSMIYDRRLNLYDFVSPSVPYGTVAGERVNNLIKFSLSFKSELSYSKSS